jgi:hypothetical protein
MNIVSEFSAKRVLRLTKDKGFVEKGGGKDGDYRFSKVQIIHDQEHNDSIPYIAIRYGLKPTVVAVINQIKAVLHNDSSKTVLLTLKNHVGWTRGMTRTYFITFVDEIDASSFMETYNKYADLIACGYYSKKNNYNGENVGENLVDHGVLKNITNQDDGGTMKEYKKRI